MSSFLPCWTVGIRLLSSDEKEPGPVGRQGGARPPVLDRAQLVPFSGPEVVVFHRKVLEQNTFKGLTHFDHVFSIP